MRLTFQYNLGYVINEAIFGSPFSGFENIFFRQLFCSTGCVILSYEKIIKTYHYYCFLKKNFEAPTECGSSFE